VGNGRRRPNRQVWVNGALVLPAFGHASADAQAVATMRRLLPRRTVLAVPARELVLGGGGLHCVTLHEPLLQSSHTRPVEL
jgi:agmatine deiminase